MAQEVKLRAFLALPLARLFYSDVAPFVEKLEREYSQVRWVSASEIHLTVHFFGPIPREEAARISDLVRPLTEKTKPFELFLEGLGAFPNLFRPRVIWLGIKGDISALQTLQISIEENLKRFGFVCEERRFKPHLTLGRVREGERSLRIQKTDFGPTQAKAVNELILFQSHLTPGGAHYETLATFPFSTP